MALMILRPKPKINDPNKVLWLAVAHRFFSLNGIIIFLRQGGEAYVLTNENLTQILSIYTLFVVGSRRLR